MNVDVLKITDIAVPKDRIRKADVFHVAQLAEDIATTGRMNCPIEVRKKGRSGYEIVAGLHRLEACRLLGHETIEAMILSCSDKEAKLREVGENLIRHELSLLARAKCLLLWKEVHLELYPETQHGGDRISDQVRTVRTWSEENVRPQRFSGAAAEKLGVSEATIARLVQIAKGLTGPVQAMLDGTMFEDSRADLVGLGALVERPDEQLRVTEEMLATGKGFAAVWAGDDDAPASAGTASRAEKQYVAAWQRYSRADADAKRLFIERLLSEGELDAVLPRLGLQRAA